MTPKSPCWLDLEVDLQFLHRCAPCKPHARVRRCMNHTCHHLEMGPRQRRTRLLRSPDSCSELAVQLAKMCNSGQRSRGKTQQPESIPCGRKQTKRSASTVCTVWPSHAAFVVFRADVESGANMAFSRPSAFPLPSPLSPPVRTPPVCVPRAN